MSLLYKEEHKECIYYAAHDQNIFDVVQVAAGERVDRLRTDKTALFFLLEGESSLFSGDMDKPRALAAGDVILLPRQRDGIVVEAVSGCRFLVCIFPHDVKLCTRYGMRELARYPVSDATPVHSLKLSSRLILYVELMETVLEDGVKCIHFQKMKREELFLYFRLEYTKEELSAFFNPIFNAEQDFEEFVMSNCCDLFDIKQMSQKANMSSSTFARRFKETFGTTPGQWMIERKSALIMDDILSRELTLSQISDKHGFSSLSYFTSFCRRVLGKSPHEIRNRKID